MIPVKDHKNLYRDEKSGAILNTDTDGFKQYKKMKRFKSNQRDEIERMKQDIEEIKSLLREIVKK
tara:strand:- start:736 stop:930 length:195 start_codon:yes stop_codon:yes gene_type:complete